MLKSLYFFGKNIFNIRCRLPGTIYIDRCTYNNATKHEKGLLLLLFDIFHVSRSCNCLVDLFHNLIHFESNSFLPNYTMKHIHFYMFYIH